MGFFTDTIYTEVVKQIVDAFIKVPAELVGPAVSILLSGVTLRLVWQGLELIRGQGGANPFLDLISQNLKAMFILVFALTASQYNGWIVDIVKTDLPTIFVGAAEKAFSDITTTPASSAGFHPNTNACAITNASQISGINIDRLIFQSLDKNVNDQLCLMKVFSNEASRHLFAITVTTCSWGLFDGPCGLDMDVTGLPAYLVLGLIFLVVIISAILVAFEAVFIVVASNFVLAFGPIFIALYAFEKTEQYATHWLQSVLKYMFGIIVILILYNLFGGVLSVAMKTFVSGYLGDPRNVGRFLAGCVAPIAIAAVGAYVLTKAEHLASDLIGGGVSGSGAFAAAAGGAVAGAVSGAVGAAAKVGGAVGGAASKGAGLAYAGTLGKGHTNPIDKLLGGWKEKGQEEKQEKKAAKAEKAKSGGGGQSSSPSGSMMNASAKGGAG